MRLCPKELEILLHYYQYSHDYGDDLKGSELRDIPELHELKIKGMLKDDGQNSFIDITDKGNAYIDACLKLPEPKQIWIVPNE